MKKILSSVLLLAAVGLVVALPACQSMDKSQAKCAACGGKGCEKCAPSVCEACHGRGCEKCAKPVCKACGGKGCAACKDKAMCDACGGKGCAKCKKKM